MAFEIPITFQVGVMIGHDTLNVYLRDNLNEMGSHNHNKLQVPAVGYGAPTLSSITMVTLIDAAIPGAPGTFIGTSFTRVFSTATTVGIRSGTGTGRILSDSTHTHGGL